MARAREPRRLPPGVEPLPPVRAGEEVRLLPWVRLSQSQGLRELLPLLRALQHGWQTARGS